MHLGLLLKTEKQAGIKSFGTQGNWKCLPQTPNSFEVYAMNDIKHPRI
jgi:hypothetical protein